jgi:hypothetical protein
VESNKQLVGILIEVLKEIIGVFNRDDYQKYLEETLFAENWLVNWLACLQPDFNTFKFIELPNFQSIKSDYF